MFDYGLDFWNSLVERKLCYDVPRLFYLRFFYLCQKSVTKYHEILEVARFVVVAEQLEVDVRGEQLIFISKKPQKSLLVSYYLYKILFFTVV